KILSNFLLLRYLKKIFYNSVAELRFISCLLEKPDLSVKTALKSIFRKSQVRTISEKFGLNLNAQIVCLSPSQWLNCFLEMLEVVPEKFHPS
ncbi:rRNA adenine N-6-methyltransferase family protein, partial [Parabacteroides distasonis]